MSKAKKERFSFKRLRLSLFSTLIFLSSCIVSGCITPPTYGLISNDTSTSILPGANKVIINSGLQPDSLYHQFFEVLSKEGYTINHSSDKFHQISAKGIETDVLVNVIINSESNGSKAIMTGGWSYKDTELRAQWKGIGYFPRYSFASLVKIAQQVKGTVMYSK